LGIDFHEVYTREYLRASVARSMENKQNPMGPFVTAVESGSGVILAEKRLQENLFLIKAGEKRAASWK